MNKILSFVKSEIKNFRSLLFRTKDGWGTVHCIVSGNIPDLVKRYLRRRKHKITFFPLDMKFFEDNNNFVDVDDVRFPRVVLFRKDGLKIFAVFVGKFIVSKMYWDFVNSLFGHFTRVRGSNVDRNSRGIVFFYVKDDIVAVVSPIRFGEKFVFSDKEKLKILKKSFRRRKHAYL